MDVANNHDLHLNQNIVSFFVVILPPIAVCYRFMMEICANACLLPGLLING
ncbi:hypothetical protein HMPREF0880_00358 [Yokenella regensburgei ATCC 43003]|nr:hypothetical protein HMPREF0880_00358 [Yokenella regensburgei ATCC 43003]